jgi:hypothetical protein
VETWHHWRTLIRRSGQAEGYTVPSNYHSPPRPPPGGWTAPSGSGPPHYRGFTITIIYMHHIRQDSTGRVISPTQRPLPDNTQHSQETDIHAPSGIRTHKPARERPQTHDLDHAATEIGNNNNNERECAHIQPLSIKDEKSDLKFFLYIFRSFEMEFRSSLDWYNFFNSHVSSATEAFSVDTSEMWLCLSCRWVEWRLRLL